MDSSTLTIWTGPFPVKGMSDKFLLLPWFTEIPVLNANSVLWRQIWVYAICKCPFYGTPGLNGLKFCTDDICFFLIFPQKTEFDISCKLSSKTKKYQILFCGTKFIKNVILSSAELAQRLIVLRRLRCIGCRHRRDESGSILFGIQ